MVREWRPERGDQHEARMADHSETGDASGGACGMPTGGPAQPSELVRRWTPAVVNTTHVPLARSEVRELLTGFGDSLAAAVLAGPDAPPDVLNAGTRIGHELVAAYISSPEALGSTIELVGEYLLSSAGIAESTQNRQRVNELCGQLSTGFVYALRDRLFAEQELIKLAVIKAREDSEKALVEAEARLQVLFTTTAMGIGIGNMTGRVTNANPALTQMLGYALHELRQHGVQDLLYREDRAQIFPKLLELRDGVIDKFATLARFVQRDGEPLWTYVSFSLIRDEAGRPQYPVAIVENRSYTHLLQDELQRQSVHDSLTGLANAKKFESQLEAVLANAKPEQKVALTYWDLDGFKVINDGLSKKVGDEMLRLVSRKLRAAFDPYDGLVAKVAGDGFAVLLKRSPGRIRVCDMVQEVMDDLAEPDYTLTGKEHRGVAVCASVGIVEESASNTTAHELIRRAEITLHRAKAKGKAQWMLAHAELDAIDQKHFYLGTQIPSALENGDFTVHYQPALRLDGYGLARVQAIPFWEHAELCRLHPREFIDLAEETGFVVPFGHWLLHEVGRKAGEWREQFGDAAPLLCVRLPTRIVHDPFLVRDVRRVLSEYELDPGRLQLSVPAVVMQHEDDDAVETLRALADNGLRLGVAGVGAGGISLVTLYHLGLSDVTMNSQLVESLVAGTDDAAETFTNGVSRMIAIAHMFDCTVTAGNLDTAERIDRMRDLGVDIGFGTALAPDTKDVNVEALLGQGLEQGDAG